MEIWGHCIVKNEDRYLWFAVNSVIEHLDKFMLWDSGSEDNTINICKELQKKYPNKIVFEPHKVNTPDDMTSLRQQMLERTKSDWIFILDGDEVWWSDSITEVIKIIKYQGKNLDSVVVPFINLVGDIYHYQDESKGEYKIDGHKGFLTIRAINAKVPGLNVKMQYPLEGYFDKNGVILQEMSRSRRIFVNKPYLHFTHLERSSLVKNKKYKFDLGNKFSLDYFYPEVFFKEYPMSIPSLWYKYNSRYQIKSKVLRPAKKLKQWTR